MPPIRFSGMLAAIVLASAGPALASDSDDPPAVLVELFTSQGCSSCPPADRLLARLARVQDLDGIEVIPLAFHVDYWNHLGWKDPFSSAEWSDRQHAYAAAMRLDTVYTPQLVVNGIRQIVGSDEREVRRAVSQVANRSSPFDLQLRVVGITADPSLRIEVGASLPEQQLDGRVVGLLALYQDGLVTPVSRGENARRTLDNERVVRRLESVLELAPGQHTASKTVELLLNQDWPLDDLGIVLFLQDPASLEILGATTTRLRPAG